jgi:hypothetical protein
VHNVLRRVHSICWVALQVRSEGYLFRRGSSIASNELDPRDKSLGDVDEGYRISQLGFSLYEVFDSKAWLARISALYFELVHGWINLIDECKLPLEYACHLGLESGDTEAAGACAVVSLFNRWETTRLPELAVEWDSMADMLTVYGQDYGILVTASTRQFVANLMETSESDPGVIDGKFFNSTTMSEFNSVRLWARLHQAQLKVIFCQYSTIAFQADDVRQIFALAFGPRSRGYSLFMCGFLDIISAGQRRRRRAPFAKNCSRLLRKCATWGEPTDFIGKHYFLEAELAALSGAHDALPLYVSAIATAQKGIRYLQTALANERAAKFLLKRNDRRQADRFFREAVVWYKECGASAKVCHLEQEMCELGI